MKRKTIFTLAILSILISALIKFYIRDLSVGDAHELLDFLSGFLLAAGVLLPFSRFGMKNKM